MAATPSDVQGPEIEGTRISVYTLLPHFLNGATTESYICDLYGLQPVQVAAARAYILNNVDTVLGQHLQIEARMTAGNPPDVIESANKSYESMLKFKEWLAQEKAAELAQNSDESLQSSSGSESERFPTFQQWFAERESRPDHGS